MSLVRAITSKLDETLVDKPTGAEVVGRWQMVPGAFWPCEPERFHGPAEQWLDEHGMHCSQSHFFIHSPERIRIESCETSRLLSPPIYRY